MTLSERAMLATLSISQWTARKLDKRATREVAQAHGNDADWLRANKRLIAKDALDKIAKAANDARLYHYSRTLPWADTGARILPASLYLDYAEKMRAYKAGFASNVATLLTNYPALIEEAKIRLNGLFNQEDYPPPKVLEKKFSFTVDILPLPDATDFRVSLDADTVAAIRSDIETTTQQRIAEATRSIWQRLYTVVKHAADKLSDPDAIFRDSTIENLREITAILPMLNITGDPNLELIGKDIETKLSHYHPDTLRNVPEERNDAAAAADEIAKKMESFMAPVA